MNHFQKHMIVLRGYFSGAKLFKALEALEVASEIHNGMRKDGVTPEFQHQLEICEILMPFSEKMDRDTADRLFFAAISHDIMEDYPPSHYSHLKYLKENEDCYLLDKSGKSTHDYYVDLPDSAVASMVKAADRVHNIESMAGVFSPEKIKKYIEETRKYVLPMMKTARRQHPEYMTYFTHMSQRIKNHIRTIEAFL
jgi:(p)ppGpp synthase/HD superfamily hydrolase